MFAGLKSGNRLAGMKMIQGADKNRIHGGMIQNLAKVLCNQKLIATFFPVVVQIIQTQPANSNQTKPVLRPVSRQRNAPAMMRPDNSKVEGLGRMHFSIADKPSGTRNLKKDLAPKTGRSAHSLEVIGGRRRTAEFKEICTLFEESLN